MEQRKKDLAAFIPPETIFQAIAAILPDMGSPAKLCEKFVELTENKVQYLVIVWGQNKKKTFEPFIILKHIMYVGSGTGRYPLE